MVARRMQRPRRKLSAVVSSWCERLPAESECRVRVWAGTPARGATRPWYGAKEYGHLQSTAQCDKQRAWRGLHQRFLELDWM